MPLTPKKLSKDHAAGAATHCSRIIHAAESGTLDQQSSWLTDAQGVGWMHIDIADPAPDLILRREGTSERRYELFVNPVTANIRGVTEEQAAALSKRAAQHIDSFMDTMEKPKCGEAKCLTEAEVGGLLCEVRTALNYAIREHLGSNTAQQWNRKAGLNPTSLPLQERPALGPATERSATSNQKSIPSL